MLLNISKTSEDKLNDVLYEEKEAFSFHGTDIAVVLLLVMFI